MIVLRPSEIYISTANVDMRKSIDGLASVVQQQFRLDPLSDAMFVFHNRGTKTASVCSTSEWKKGSSVFLNT